MEKTPEAIILIQIVSHTIRKSNLTSSRTISCELSPRSAICLEKGVGSMAKPLNKAGEGIGGLCSCLTCPCQSLQSCHQRNHCRLPLRPRPRQPCPCRRLQPCPCWRRQTCPMIRNSSINWIYIYIYLIIMYSAPLGSL